ncbi:MAG: NAD(P)/FAD-dependent oxidoreductase [Gammaproteobacteria bacterium]
MDINKPMNDYDAVIIGAGHNGLICATSLARKGRKVLLLEAQDRVGGLGATREFYPGFKATVAHSIGHLPAHIVSDFDLDKYGLEVTSEPLNMIGLDKNGNHVHVNDNGVSGVGKEDNDAYSEYSRLMNRFADTLKPFWLKGIPDIDAGNFERFISFGHMGWKLRRLGKEDMREFFRIVSLPTRDLMDENFNNELLKAVLSWDGLIGSALAPRSPNAAVLTLLYRMTRNYNGLRSHIVPKGGVAGLIRSLEHAATAAGVEIRTSTPVKRIAVEGGETGLSAAGVEIDGGETIRARAVISSADPCRTFLELLGARHLEIGFSHRIKRMRCKGYVAKLHLALDDIPEFKGLDTPMGRLIIAADMDAIEFAYDDAKYGNFSSGPVMEIVIPTMYDSGLAPHGKHILSAHVMYAPYTEPAAVDADAKTDFMNRTIDRIAEFSPGIQKITLHKELLTPSDLEHEYNLTGGHWHHAEFSMDQMLMMRPTYEAGQYHTPVDGLYLCGAGSHPGGDITGAPGYNAAHRIMAGKKGI